MQDARDAHLLLRKWYAVKIWNLLLQSRPSSHYEIVWSLSDGLAAASLAHALFSRMVSLLFFLEKRCFVRFVAV